MKDERVYELTALNNFYDWIIKGNKYKLKRSDASSGWSSTTEVHGENDKWCTWDIENLTDTFGNVEQRIKEQETQIETNIYHFRDTEINFEQVCIDMLEDNISSFIIIGKDSAYIGCIKSLFSDWSKDDCLPYDIIKIEKDLVGNVIKELKEWAKLYKDRKEDLKRYIQDRKRDKENNKFKVMTFK